MMKKFFNVAGPCNPEEHYMLPAQARCEGLLDLIEQKQYFVIHHVVERMRHNMHAVRD